MTERAPAVFTQNLCIVMTYSRVNYLITRLPASRLILKPGALIQLRLIMQEYPNHVMLFGKHFLHILTMSP